jgi:cathepsin F
LTSDEEIFKQFTSFQKTFGKQYNHAEEFKHRFEIFKMNYNRIDLTNFNLEKSGQKSHEFGITQFMDLTPTEFAKTHLNLKMDMMSKIRARSVEQKPTFAFGDAPENFDWREKGVVSSVKDQGSCGSCWAFSAMGNIESEYAIKTGKVVDFSEQQLVDCDKGQDEGCNGGLMEYAFKYLEDNGVMADKDYSYTGSDGTCKYDKTKVVAHVTGYEFAPKDEAQMKQLLFENGPYAIAINATPLQFYFWGIFDPWFQWICSPEELNHGVLLVGYGVESGKPYWIVKYSWGASWGESGYFRIVAGKGACGIDQYVVTAKVDN